VPRFVVIVPTNYRVRSTTGRGVCVGESDISEFARGEAETAQQGMFAEWIFSVLGCDSNMQLRGVRLFRRPALGRGQCHARRGHSSYVLSTKPPSDERIKERGHPKTCLDAWRPKIEYSLANNGNTRATIALLVWVYWKVFVLEMFRNTLRLFHLDLLRGDIQRIVSFATLLRMTHVSRGMGEGNACFR
jgi:hypothetical protein